MRGILMGVCVGLLLMGCKEAPQKVLSDQADDFELQQELWPKKKALSSAATTILANWVQFQAMEVSFDALSTVASREDLVLVLEEILEKQKLLLESDYPAPFDKPQIKGRLKTFKTYVLKVRGDLTYRTDPHPSLMEMIEAHNAFREQFNIIINNTLDTKLIRNE